MNSRKKKIVHIVAGPTAGGKSARALDLAREKDGVIINADSMQIFDALPLLTAQPPEEDKQAAPHELYGALHPNESCSAGNWREMAIPLIEAALARGQVPVICGGSGLYIKALTDGLSPVPDIPEEIRRAASNLQQELGNPAFHAELAKRDPVMAARFHPYHTARLIRAWEVLEATGKSLAEWQELPPEPPPADWEFRAEIILPERDALYSRCNARFLMMLEQGALAEAEAFDQGIKSGEIRGDCRLTKALGLRPLLAHIHGQLSRKEAIESAQAETRHYAKRQVTWFRHQLKIK